MAVEITQTTIRNILTRSSGYLKTVCSHSLQPYRGCTFGSALCGVGCYVRHNGHVLKGRSWGEFLEVRTNAAESYLTNFQREKTWARRNRGRFSIFCSSSTDPFVPQERRYRITQQLLEAMSACPSDELILQTHSRHVLDALPKLVELKEVMSVRVQVSIESDRDRLPGLPSPASSVEQRLEACAALKAAGIRTVVTVAPLLPIANPSQFFQRISEAADAVIIDHFIGGDGSDNGRRTLRTALPAAMKKIDPESVEFGYRDQMIEIARQHLPGKVGVSIEGFAGTFQ